MALKFHYNKTTIQQFTRQLAIREKALPILRHKETALRLEVVKLTHEMARIEEQRNQLEGKLDRYRAFWSEFPEILLMDKLDVFQKKIIGIRIPEVRSVEFKIADVSWWNLPAWVPAGIKVMMEVVNLDVKQDILRKQIELLDLARKKATQKVNLYEKIQIPGYEEAILKIRRFLEDKENISKAAQKIVKKRKEERTA